MAITASQNLFECSPATPARFIGEFASLSALETAHPTAPAGSYAVVNAEGADLIYYYSITDEAWFTPSSDPSGIPTLPQVLAQGDRTIRLSDGDGETILELNDRGKLVYNQDGDFILLPAELYPVNTVLKIHNVSEVDLFCIPDVELNPSIQVNGVTVDEFSGITLRAGTAVLKKISGDAYAESWLLTFEVLDFSKDAIGLGSVDNTADLSKPVSTAQAAAIASALSTAQSYTDNIKLKRPARVAIDTNVSLSGDLTVGSIVLVTGDVVLCLAQTDAKQNGLWVVNQLGPWVRTQDFRTGLDVSFCWIPVLAGNYAARFFSTGANRIVGTDNITLQDQTFLALLTGISFSTGTDVVAADTVIQALGKLQKQLTDVRTSLAQRVIVLYNDVFDTTPVTGVTGNTLLKSYSIPANLMADGDSLYVRIVISKTGTNATAVSRLNTNTSASISGASQLSTFSSGNTIVFIPIVRTLSLKAGNLLEVFPSNTTAVSDDLSASVAASNISFDKTVQNFIIPSVQPNSASDSFKIISAYIVLVKSKTSI